MVQLHHKTLWKTLTMWVLAVLSHSGSKQTNRQEALFALWLTPNFYVASVWPFKNVVDLS